MGISRSKADPSPCLHSMSNRVTVDGPDAITALCCRVFRSIPSPPLPDGRGKALPSRARFPHSPCQFSESDVVYPGGGKRYEIRKGAHVKSKGRQHRIALGPILLHTKLGPGNYYQLADRCNATASGPAVVHASDSSLVTAAKPA